MRIVYIVENLINKKVYIGQTKCFSQRKANHVYSVKRNVDRPLYRSMRKHGIDNFEFRILEECDDSTVNEREQYWVSFYSSNDSSKGYNLTNGGNYFEHTIETRLKISEKGKGLKRSESTKKKISLARKGTQMSEEQKSILSQVPHSSGENHPMFGKHHSDETRERMKNNHKGMIGKNHSDESKSKISKAKKGKKLSDEHRRKLSEAARRRYQK